MARVEPEGEDAKVSIDFLKMLHTKFVAHEEDFDQKEIDVD